MPEPPGMAIISTIIQSSTALAPRAPVDRGGQICSPRRRPRTMSSPPPRSRGIRRLATWTLPTGSIRTRPSCISCNVRRPNPDRLCDQGSAGATVARVEAVTTEVRNELSCYVVEDKPVRHIPLAPPEGDGDHAIEPGQDEPFQPGRLPIIDDEGAQHSR